MSTITVEEAQQQLPQILDQLRPGEEVTITVRGRPVAQVKKTAAPTRPPRVPGSAKGMLVILQEDDDHLKDFAEYMK